MPASSSSSSPTSFPIVAIAIVGILGTAALLLGYYILVIKCCLDFRREEADSILRRLSRSGRLLQRHLAAFAPAERHRGLDPRAIRAIPTFRHSPPPASDCPVCLVEFRGGERLRRLPGCGHAFHVDCIDTWLESSASCPLCRAEVEEKAAAIEIGETVAGRARAGRAGSKGDECVGVRRDKDESFAVQPMRRSVSLDSLGDEKLSGAARGQRLFAALGGWRTGRSLRRAVQPVEILEV